MRRVWPPLALLAATAGMWELIVRAAHVPNYLFPTPSAVASSLADDGGRLAIFRRVELPGALPAIFSGARVAATYAAVGAVFGEWAGSSAGLGFVILQAQPALETARIFAAVLILSALALCLYALVTFAERLLVPWQPEARNA